MSRKKKKKVTFRYFMLALYKFSNNLFKAYRDAKRSGTKSIMEYKWKFVPKLILSLLIFTLIWLLFKKMTVSVIKGFLR